MPVPAAEPILRAAGCTPQLVETKRRGHARELLRRRVRPARLRLLTSGRTKELLEGRYVMVLACNTRDTGAGMWIEPRARLDDGPLDLLIVPELSRARLLALMWRIPSGRHIEVPELRYRQVSGFELLAGKGGGRPRPGRLVSQRGR